MAEPPLYNSFDGDDGNCCFCKDDTDNSVMYGDKFKYDNLALHHFCLVSVQREKCCCCCC